LNAMFPMILITIFSHPTSRYPRKSNQTGITQTLESDFNTTLQKATRKSNGILRQFETGMAGSFTNCKSKISNHKWI
jgi:hypothetical protein